MIPESEKHRRLSIRLKGFDYSQPGAYFITICTHDKECLFGHAAGEKIILNDAGKAVETIWNELPRRFRSAQLDAFVVMPNHVHGVIILAESEPVGALLAAPKSGRASTAPTVGEIIRAFKSITAIAINRLLCRSRQPLWQRNYYEHVVRNEQDLNDIRQYIVNNPKLWALDRENSEITMTP